MREVDMRENEQHCQNAILCSLLKVYPEGHFPPMIWTLLLLDPVNDPKTTVHFDNMLIIQQHAQDIIPPGISNGETYKRPVLQGPSG